jgi:hypothetical protein
MAEGKRRNPGRTLGIPADFPTGTSKIKVTDIAISSNLLCWLGSEKVSYAEI